REQTKQACRQDALAGDADKLRNFTRSLAFKDEAWRYLLFPVYLATYVYDEETYQIVINGQTGSIGGERPVAWIKIALVAAAAFIPAFGLGILGLIFPPLFFLVALVLAAGIGGVVVLITSARRIIDPELTKEGRP
ncbi:MAG: hypothetical protein GYB68_13705, partial [Chloroflexi bacterium]|nr:hypothetical protein [Chloroflexota bacterium]